MPLAFVGMWCVEVLHAIYFINFLFAQFNLYGTFSLHCSFPLFSAIFSPLYLSSFSRFIYFSPDLCCVLSSLLASAQTAVPTMQVPCDTEYPAFVSERTIKENMGNIDCDGCIK